MSKCHNYLRSNRKRLELSQQEAAFLLGGNDVGKISKHETRSVEPSLSAAIAYVVVYKRSLRELFPGIYQKVEKEVAARARILAYRVDRGRSPRRCKRRRQAFEELADQPSLKPLNRSEDDKLI